MPPDPYTFTTMAAPYMHWNVELPGPGHASSSSLPEIVNVLPGDTLVFCGAAAAIIFPEGLMDSESESAPGIFRVNPLADDGSYTYHVVYPGEEAPRTKGTVRIGLICELD